MIRISTLLATLLLATTALADPPVGPTQPATGPGGRSYAHARVAMSTYLKAEKQYWLFEPAEPKPTGPVPMIVFGHGWGGMDPGGYGAWIEHLVKRGNVVVYPRYQAHMLTMPDQMMPGAIAAIADALKRLDGKTHVAIDRAKVAMVGHSLGGVIVANLAARAADAGLPVPRALFVIQPGDSNDDRGWRAFVPSMLIDYSRIAPETLMLVLVGAEDNVVGDKTARKIFDGARRVPPANRNLLVMQSDRRGTPALIASHQQPFSPDWRYSSDAQARARTGRISYHLNAHDYFGTWRLLDGLCDAAWNGGDRRTVLGDTPEQRHLGTWSDGTPIRPLKVVIPAAAKLARPKAGKTYYE